MKKSRKYAIFGENRPAPEVLYIKKMPFFKIIPNFLIKINKNMQKS